jgi:hypothetical protein
MNAITWTVKQLERRRELIEQLYMTADPGTFSNLDQLSLEELQELASIMDPGDVA